MADKDKITKAMLAGWISHPVSQGMLGIVRERLAADKEYLNGLIINGPSIGTMDMHILSQLKGQILAYEEVLKTKDFLMELTEEEVENDAKSSGPTSAS